jgi:hypothetical protein
MALQLAALPVCLQRMPPAAASALLTHTARYDLHSILRALFILSRGDRGNI